MISQQDLKILEKLLDKNVEQIVEELEDRIEEFSLEIQKEIILLKAEMKREFRKARFSSPV